MMIYWISREELIKLSFLDDAKKIHNKEIALNFYDKGYEMSEILSILGLTKEEFDEALKVRDQVK